MKSEILQKILQKRRNDLTYPQKRFVAGVVSGLSPTKSAKEAYPTATYGSQKVMAVENMKKPKIKTAIEKALTKHNITEDRILGIVNEAIDTPSPLAIDWNTKHNYIKTALQLKGYLNNKKDKSKTQVNVQLNLE